MPSKSMEPVRIVVYDRDKFLQDKFMGQVSGDGWLEEVWPCSACSGGGGGLGLTNRPALQDVVSSATPRTETKRKEVSLITLVSMIVTHLPSCLLPCRKELGSVRLKVQCREERILDPALYTPFVQLMLGAVENVTVSVLCRTFLCIYLVNAVME